MVDVSTDVSRPSALPTGILRPTLSQSHTNEQKSEEYLAQVEEEWNKKVDIEVETLVDGMVDLVSLASVGLGCDVVLMVLNEIRGRLGIKISSK